MDVIACNGFSPGLGTHCWDWRILHLYRTIFSWILEPSSLCSGREWEPSSSLSLHGQAWEDPGNEFEHNLGLWFCLSAGAVWFIFQEIWHVYAKQIAKLISESSNKPVLLGIALKKHSPQILQQILHLLQANKVWWNFSVDTSKAN